MSDEIEKLSLGSEDLVEDRLEQMRKLVPEAFSEGGVDFHKLRLLLGDEVDEGDERYAFTWPGKADAIRQSQTTSHATLRPCVEKSRGRGGEDGSFDSGNVYIEGDNLEVLKLMQRAYHGKVKFIYIDPPYNTGHDFVYHDKFGDTVENYREQTGQTSQSNPETSGRFHSDWCSMMYPRLKLARELLSNRGAICISIDDNEVVALRAICNEIFGESGFVAQIPRQSRASVQNDTDISVNHEYILIYAKTRRSANRRLKESNASEWYRAESFACYPKALDPSRYDNPDNDPRGPWKADPFDAPNVRPNLTYPIVNPDTGEQHLPPRGRCWRTEPAKYQALLAENRIVFGKNGKGRPQLKVFYEEKKAFGEVDNTWWDASRISVNSSASKALAEMFDGALPFDTPKPVDLIENLIRLVLPEDEENVVFDFFSGSASTAHAAMLMNFKEKRKLKFIMVQLPEKPDESTGAGKNAAKLCEAINQPKTICTVAEERIRRAGKRISEEVEEENRQLKLGEEPKRLPDIGFRVFRLDDSGIERPRDGQLLIDRRKPGRSDLDIIFEAMLRWGYELTYPVEETEFAGYPCYSVAAGDLVCCMQPGLTTDALEAIAASQPRRVLMMDSAIDDTTKLNALAIFRRVEERAQQKIELRTV